MEQDIIKSTFEEYVAPLNSEIFLRQINELQADKYMKKFDTLRFAKLFIFAQLDQIKSLSDL